MEDEEETKDVEVEVVMVVVLTIRGKRRTLKEGGANQDEEEFERVGPRTPVSFPQGYYSFNNPGQRTGFTWTTLLTFRVGLCHFPMSYYYFFFPATGPYRTVNTSWKIMTPLLVHPFIVVALLLALPASYIHAADRHGRDLVRSMDTVSNFQALLDNAKDIIHKNRQDASSHLQECKIG